MTLPMRPLPSEIAEPLHIHIRVWTDALTGDPVDVWCPHGATIAEIVAAIPLPPEREARRAHLEAWLGGHHIPRDHWRLVRPAAWAMRAPVTLIIRLPISGKGGRKVLALVAAVALITLTAAIGGGALAGAFGSAFKAGAWGARLAAAAVSMAGSLAMQGLLKPPSPEKDSKDPLSVASATNDFEPGAPLQRVIGRMLVPPQCVVPPFTSLDNGVKRTNGTTRWSQYVTVAYALAGRHQIEAIYVDGVDVATIPGLEVETREGLPTDALLTLAPDTRIERQVDVAMSGWETDPDDSTGSVEILGTVAEAGPDWHRVEAGHEAEQVRIEFGFPSGLVRQTDSGIKTAGLSLRGRMRLRGAAAWGGWINIPEMLIRAKEPNDPLRLHLEVHWVDTLPSTAANAWPPSARAWTRVKGWGRIWTHAAWASPLATPHRDGYAQWEYQSDKRIILYLLKSAYPQGRWQFEFKRSWPFAIADWHESDDTVSAGGHRVADFFVPPIPSSGATPPKLYLNPADVSDQLQIVSIQSRWSEYPIVTRAGDTPLTLLALRAKGRSIGRVQMLVTGVCEAWTGSAWVAAPTRDPASWYREVLRGPHNAQPIEDDLIDTATLIDWSEWAAAAGHTADMIVSGRSVVEVLQGLALAGWASPSFGAQYGVTIERPRSPVGVISHRNARKFTFRKAFGDLPHGLKITFPDAVDDYAPREITVYAPGYAEVAGAGLLEARLFEAIDYTGLTDEASVRARAALDYAWRIHRSTHHGCEMDIEMLEFRRGDLVLWQTDIIGAATGSGRVTEVTLDGAGRITALRLDDEQTLVGGSSDLLDVVDLTRAADLWVIGRWGISIRCDDGAVVTVEAVSGATPDLVLLAAPLDMPRIGGTRDAIGEGTLVVCGRLDQSMREVIVWEIAPGPDLTAEITAVDYAGAHVYGS